MTSVELDKTSSAINAILHPEDHVVNSTFERYVSENLFAQEKFDAIVGNPPYGPRDDSMIQDVGYRDIKLADQYFVTRCIDMVRPGGLICLVLPSRIVEGSKLKKWRRQIAMKAEFLGAQRLPTGTFGNNGSDSVVTDVVIWRKHPAALAGSIERASVELLESTNVLWDTWINGKWYQRDGKKYIHGTEHTVGQGAWARKVVDRGGRTDDDIKRALSHKFDSRIDWETLEIKAPETRVYAEGEYKIINGQQMRMDNGEWVSAVQQDATGSLNTAVYGVTSTDEIAVMTANQASMLKADFSHLKNIHRDLPGECDPAFIENMQAAMALPEAQQERAFRGMLLGQLVRDVSNLAAQQDGSEGLSDALTMKRENVAGLVFAEYEKFGLPTKLKHTSKLKGGALANWHAFAQSIDKNGTLSDLLDGKLKRESTVDFDHADPAQVAAAFYKQQMTSVDVATFRKAMTDPKDDMSDEQLLSWLAQQDGLAINSDGTISPIHHATSGEISAKLDTLYMAIKNALDTNVANNLQRQVELINSRRKWTDITDIKFKLTDGWIDKSILIEFLQSRGYDYFDYSKVIVGEDGTEKVVPADGDDGFFTGYRMRDGQKRNNQDERFERQLENYLNKAPVRGGGGNEGLAAIRDQLRQLDADFGLWLSTSDHADTVAAEYNSRFNGYIAPEYDDTSLELENLSGNIDLMGYQNATIRRFSDEGCGIIGYGTGLGKTFTGLGLAAYNIQVGRSKRVVFVVPKSVLENWYHEADTFFGANNLGDKVFIGIEPVKDKDGNVMREPVLDEEGQPVIKNGKPLTRAKLEVDTSTKKVAPKLHQLTHSSAKMVFMTKDVFASIPLREETISDNVSDMVDNGLVAGSNKYAAIAETYREQAKNAKFRAKHADDGSTKKHDLPYFEDLLIDSVITDEGHNYRNSYKSGGMGNRLAFLPNTQTANMALDMQIKNNYVKRVNRDRGCYSLTATPTVNSPIDAFNMLSQIIPQAVWAKMGIIDSDDFIRMFGKTGETAVHKLSGKVETKEALLGSRTSMHYVPYSTATPKSKTSMTLATRYISLS
ncbi:DNA methylase [Photobacterium aphoticum]|uniref:DNA methylase n=1 Tax=Photobacterium aphoticum TaxID=754436 RepID=A0A090QYB4_9GAMM|nr:DNA methylase [Photobacterium aphoticum]